MADLFKFELVSPEDLLLSQDVRQVLVPGTEGNFTVLPGHAPLLSTLRPGVLDVLDEQGREDRIYVRGGIAEVNPNGLTVLAEDAVPLAELSAEMLAQQVRNAEEDVADATDDEKRRRAQESLDHLRDLQSALKPR
jgi:F-type H+-transporting ATPase subunit epsilon